MGETINHQKTVKAKNHISEIRKRKFLIGEKRPNPLTDDLQNAVATISSEVYANDSRFLMELIQNAEDNKYSPEVTPAIEFVLTSSDVAGVGAPATLLVFNNEVGFSRSDVESICSIGKSTKKGKRQDQGFIGEKGIGFKSVFLISSCPHVFSRGYQIRFSDVPDADSGIGYIVPEWIATNNKPTVSELQSIYGSDDILLTTTIVLPLKPEKVESVKKQLSDINPEVLLFLRKIKRISVREINGNCCSTDSISAHSIYSETDPTTIKSQKGDCRSVRLSVREEVFCNVLTCCYHVWDQIFSVEENSKVDSRKDIKEWTISLAFPSGKRLDKGTPVGIFAFLPTKMITNFPFIVQADFILSSSREDIVLDNKWNKGILDQVPSAFMSAFTTFMESTITAEYFTTDQVLDFLSAKESLYKELRKVRQSIESRLKKECIVPQRAFLEEETQGHTMKHCIVTEDISSLGKSILHESVAYKKFKGWDYLGMPVMDDCNEYNGRFIQAFCRLFSAPPGEYADLLCFFADYWEQLPLKTFINIPVFKYIAQTGEIKQCSILDVEIKQKIYLVWEVEEHVWLNKWNLEMGCPDNMFFFPNDLVVALVGHAKENSLKKFLVEKVGLVVTTIPQYCAALSSFVGRRKDSELAVKLSHFIYHSFLNNYIQGDKIFRILCSMPVSDKIGNVLCAKTLVPASGSKWVKLFGCNNPDIEGAFNGNYVELGSVYAEAAKFGGVSTAEKELLDFLTKHAVTFDLPDIIPQDIAFPVVTSQLTCDQALLLLGWIRSLRASNHEMPMRFKESIMTGKWLKTYSGFYPPIYCFLSDGTEVCTLLEMAKLLRVLSVVDDEYYMNKIRSFKDELRYIGVHIGSEDVHPLIIEHFKPLASNAMDAKFAIFLLTFIRYLMDNNKLNGEFITTLKEGKWLKTNMGYTTPAGSVYLSSDVSEAFAQLSDRPVVDRAYYESHFDFFADELKSLSVVVCLEEAYELIQKHFRFPEDLSTLTKESVFLLLECIQHLGPRAVGLTHRIRCQPWVKTNSGFKRSTESLLFDHKWDHLLNVVTLPIIDEAFYGSRLRSYKIELEAIGVVVDDDGASKMFSDEIRSMLSTSQLTSANVISLLNCMKHMGETMPSLLSNIMSCLSGEKWLKTCNGYKSASDAILFDPKWESFSRFANLPFIDMTYYGVDLHSYRDELKFLGVVVDLTQGAHILARDLNFPKEPALVAPGWARSLLQCLSSLRRSGNSLVEHFINKLRSSKWLKTHMGYKSPEESLFFNPEWECYLEQQDGPFLDHIFYGTFSLLEREELKVIGMKTETEEVCSLLSKILTSHTQTNPIMRIYRFLHKSGWIGNCLDKSCSVLWIPDVHRPGEGKWVPSHSCVLHCTNYLFHSCLHVLDNYYEKDLFSFLSMAFAVEEVPSLGHYVMLWHDWERGKHQVSSDELMAFWGYISANWDDTLCSTMSEEISLLPATTLSGDIQLVDKGKVLIPDDQVFQCAFARASKEPIFLWLPKIGSKTLDWKNLCDIYKRLGVRTLSESVQYDPDDILSSNCTFQKLDMRDSLIWKSLIRIILAFLSSVSMEEKQRRASVLDLSVFGAEKPIPVPYGLQLATVAGSKNQYCLLLDKRINVQITKQAIWEKKSQRLLVQISSWNSKQKNMLFTSSFARAISEAVLQSNDELVDSLSKVIRRAFHYGFEDKAVDIFLRMENLKKLTAVDKEIPNQLLPLVNSSSSALLKRKISPLESISTPEFPSCDFSTKWKRTREEVCSQKKPER